MGNDSKETIPKRDVEVERSKLMKQEAKWTQPTSIYDHLPPHERPFPIEPFKNERQRLPFKMTDEDRLRRKKYLHAQELTEREPVRVPELERLLYNPIRRLYRGPTNKLFSALIPMIGAERASFARWFVPKAIIGYIGACVVWYHLKYFEKSWEHKKGFRVVTTRPRVFPGDEPVKQLDNEDYYDLGFKSRKVFRGPDYAF